MQFGDQHLFILKKNSIRAYYFKEVKCHQMVSNPQVISPVVEKKAECSPGQEEI